ncbi:arylsulfatase [Streptomyces sp. JJ36]|uniref:arylsulfatase n=1 Tax=Streptomyces sp. JJ36 TaxID=2736645 RepID=UPI001F39D56B|nr:arylsulfatase [Streptomyces sp. JJ36]MCF6522933.1 arylsulfatase [Streptomyces sp. JJ36]
MHATTSRRKFVAAAGAALGLAGATAAVTAIAAGTDDESSDSPSAEASVRPPNVIVVLADDLGYGELGSYGQRLITTPRLDELAAEGMRFTQAYAPAPVCAPSRCSLLTGLHSGHAAVRTNPFQGPQASIGDDDTTFAELLRERGYRTACVGKWGFGPEEPHQPSHPNSRGFEEFYGYIAHGAAHDYHPDALWHNAERVALPANANGRRGTYAPDLFHERALDFLERHAGGDDPFLLYFAPNVPHAPSRRLEQAGYATRPWTQANKGHAAQVSHLDASVGAMVDLLRAKGADRDTILLVSSDNGPHDEGRVDPARFAAAGGLRGNKRNLYEGGIRVPLIAWAPGRIEPGSETDRATPLTDVLPTVAELAGARVPGNIDGVSLTGLLGGGDARPHRYLYWYRNDPHATRHSQRADHGRGLQVCEAVRQGDWKLVRFAPGRDRSVPDARWQVELYNLRTDPGERHDVAARHPRIVARLVNLAHDAWVEPQPVRA